MVSLLWLVRLANARMLADEPEREIADIVGSGRVLFDHLVLSNFL